MQLCKECWAKLKEALEHRGLTSFIAKSGEALLARVMDETSSENEKFEPLMAAHNALISNLLRAGGLTLLTHEGCPLCKMVEICGCGKGEDCDYRTWIGRAADDQLERAQKLGLLPTT